MWAPSLLKRHDVDLPGVHPAERGPGWGAVQLEPVAVQSAGSHQAGGSRLLPLHAAEGETRPATSTVRAGAVQPSQLQGSTQPTVVSLHCSTLFNRYFYTCKFFFMCDEYYIC